MYDVIIIGAGPAGISASLYTGRSNLKTLVIYKDKSNLEKAEKIDNYYGFQDGITGEELYISGINQAKKIGVSIKNEEVLKVEIEENKFKVITTNGMHECKAIIIATGNKKNVPNIKGIKEFEGKGISYCAICDGFFYRGKEIAVLGNSNYAISETNDLINIAKKITILTNGKQAPDIRAENIDINSNEIKEIKGENRVQEIEFKDNSKLKVDGIFVAEGTAGTKELAKKLGIVTKEDKIMVNENMETNIKGIYACGDCTGGLKQISKAVYEGAKAGTEVQKYIRSIK